MRRALVGVYIARFGFEYEPPGGAGAVVKGVNGRRAIYVGGMI